VTQTAQPTPAGPEQGTAEQAMEKAQETAQQVQQQAGQKAQELKSQAGSKLRTELDNRSTQAGEQVSSTAAAFRRVGEELRGEQKDGPARLADQVADRAERVGRYLTESDGERILRDLEQFARRRPWLVAVTGAAAGFLASRFVKASATRDGGSGTGGERALPERAGTGEPAMASVGEQSFVGGGPERSPGGRAGR
jgi:ElaB/YqjD/DUF883 family membrane-anchored ribosome-binding protein